MKDKVILKLMWKIWCDYPYGQLVLNVITDYEVLDETLIKMYEAAHPCSTVTKVVFLGAVEELLCEGSTSDN